jgi:serine/threonine-protein kinase
VNRDAWKRLEPLADQALEMEPAAREAFLEKLRADDPALSRELEEFLAAEEGSREFLTGPVEQRHPALLQAMGEDEAAVDGLPPGERLGPYRLVREIGRGGMGAVFLAERADGHFDQRVALKLVKRGMDTAEILERFRAERQILARLEHPHVARLLDGGVSEGGQPYFALEHVEGEPLTDHCARLGLPVAERLRLFLQVCDAVEYAHRSLVVHRDLKPSNILVTADGQAKLLDFGIAKVLDPEAGDGSVTRGELRAMTPRYAAPEQIRGQAVTTATDVYSLGVVLYEVVGGGYPYGPAGPGPGDLQRAVLEQDPRPLDGLGDLDAVVRMALRKEPERRYGSVRALAEDVRRYLAGLPVAARPDTLGYRAARFVRRHRLAVAAAALVVVSLVAGLAATLWQAREAVRQAREARRQALEAQRQARRAEAVTRFTISLFKVADPDASNGREITARELVERGAQRVQSDLGEQPELQAQMLLVIGEIDHRLGLQRQSRPLLERALELRRGLHPEDHVDVAEAQVAVGGALLQDGEFDRADELLARALRTREARLGPEDPDTVFARARLGRVRFEKGELAAAESLLSAAVAERRRRSDDPLELAADVVALAHVHYARAQWADAERLYTEALAIRRRQLGEDDTSVSECFVNLGAVKQEQGDLGGAESYFRQAIEQRRRIVGPKHDLTVTANLNLAWVLIRRGREREAEPLLRESLETVRALHGPKSFLFAAVLNQLARALRGEGRAREAEPLSREALALSIGMLGEEHLRVASVRESLARILSDRGRFPEAEDLVRRALAALRKQLAPDHPRIADATLTLAQVLASGGRPAEAEHAAAEALRLRAARYGDGDWRTGEARALLERLRGAGQRGPATNQPRE